MAKPCFDVTRVIFGKFISRNLFLEFIDIFLGIYDAFLSEIFFRIFRNDSRRKITMNIVNVNRVVLDA